MANDSIWQLDACEIADRVRDGDVSAKEVLETFAERIERYNEELNAIVHLDLDAARAQAAEIDSRIAAGEDAGLLAGVPIGIKDLEDVAGMPTTFGSVPYKDNIAAADGIQTGRLRNAGAVFVGKTASPEFGAEASTRTLLFGTTRNPWNLERTPGGSSGGSAAAVAAAVLPIASGSDGGGSIRIPASYSGLFGAKGTYGRIPKGGVEASYTTSFGCMARSVRDTARYWDCVVGSDERDAHSLPHPGFSYEAILDELPDGLRAAWSDDLGYHHATKEILGITRAAAQRVADSAGVQLVDRPIELLDMSAGWGLLNMPGSELSVGPFWPDREEDFTPVIRAGMHSRDHYDVAQIAKAIDRRQQNNERLAAAFEDVDLILTPTTGTTAFRAEGPMPMEIDGQQVKPMRVLYTYPFNVSGHPAVSIPCGFDADGLPVGLQIVGRRHEDHVLLQVARRFEQAHPWTKIATNYAS
jgi:aspartyl-tRNA(Asn)/glutamyl-tRNA(Gln) amidotransferase subunit A